MKILQRIWFSEQPNPRHKTLEFESCYSIMRQSYHWGEFNVNLSGFQAILNSHNVFAPFLDCVHLFGSKTGEDDRVWNGYRRSVRNISQGGKEGTGYGTLCMNLDTLCLTNLRF